MQKSEALFSRAQQTIPGGVNSPVRAFKAVGGTPRFITKADGPYIWDADGKQYIDYVQSWGPMVLGHNNEKIRQAVIDASYNGLSFGAPTEAEVIMAEKVSKLVPSMEMVRMVNSGTEATMSAIRLSRGYTGRNKIVKFEGCYHGHADSLLVKAGSGALTFGQPSSAGVPVDTAKHTLTLSYNNTEELEELFLNQGNDIACVILEPIVGNMNLIVPSEEFLTTLRSITEKYGALLIFDEVMTGFRVSLGGAQELFGIIPDLTTLGKVIGGGLPVGAFGGRKDIMQKLAPLGPVYQAGTLSGNPVAVAAGLKTLELIQAEHFFEKLTAQTKKLTDGLTQAAQDSSIDFCARNVGGMFGLYFSKTPPNSFSDVMSSDREIFNKFFHQMLSLGIYFGPSAFEAGFVSAAHSDTDIEFTIDCAKKAFKNI